MTSAPGPMWNGADGASAERTRLAWRRTVLAGTAVALLTVRVAVRAGIGAWTSFAIAVTALGWIAMLVIAQRRINAMATDDPRRIGRTLPTVALMTCGVALLGAVLIVAAG